MREIKNGESYWIVNFLDENNEGNYLPCDTLKTACDFALAFEKDKKNVVISIKQGVQGYIHPEVKDAPLLYVV